jgi:hypothetical protein
MQLVKTKPEGHGSSGRWAGGPTYRRQVDEGWRPRRSSSTSARGLEEPGIRSRCGGRGGRHRRRQDWDRGAGQRKVWRSRARVRVGGATVASGGVEACCGLVTSSMVGREEEQQQESLTGDEDGTGQDAEEERRRARAGEEEADTRRNKLKPIKILGPDSHYGTKGNVRRQVTG